MRGALAVLLEQGVVEWRARIGAQARGRWAKDLVLRHLPEVEAALQPSEEGGAAEGLYWRLAADRLAGALPDIVAEADLVRRYGVPRGNLHRILQQILSEGWIERAPAGGWRFLPLIDSAESYDESYRFRRAIEPAAILDRHFDSNRASSRNCGANRAG